MDGMNDSTAPTGLARRRRRLSHDETERRMLQAALDMVNSSGLTVSLDHISLEDVIRDAGVSRSAAYRRWPYKDLFFSDLLKELAAAATPAAIGRNASIAGVRAVALEHLDWLGTAQLRHDLTVELIRLGAAHDFQFMYESTEWRTYLALHATFLSLADGGLRTDVQAALAGAERGFTDRIVASWERIAGLLGYRLRAELNAGFDTLAALVSSSVRGLVVMAQSTPELATRRIRTNAFGTSTTADWSISGIGAAAIATAFLEPDPTIEWDDERIAAVRRALESEDWTAP
jgi:AcrR family transcriptional regulator